MTDAGYFEQLGTKVGSLAEGARRRVMRHVDYLAKRVGLSSDQLLAGAKFEATPALISDAVKNIDAVIQGARKSGRKLGGKLGADEIIARSASLPGWCSPEKASAIAQLVRSERPAVCVEVGIFGGRSVVPCAAILREIGEGVIYGIETWSPATATQYVTGKKNDEWWREVDFPKVKADFFKFLVENDLVTHVRIVEAPSAEVAHLFSDIDYLHIDGAHSIYNAAEDVVSYLKRVRSRGIIIMDDINWPTTAPAYAILQAFCEPISTLTDENGNDACAFLRKR
jgi:predicted O-methyltransferase YrrM